MQSEPWRYNGESLDEILALEQHERADMLAARLTMALELKDAARRSAAEHIIFAIEAMENEVNNGGFAQFFENCSEYVPGLVDALNAIGCNATAGIVAQALEVTGLGPAPNPDMLAEVVEGRDERTEELLDACDQAYYSALNEDIAGKLIEWVKLHQSEIHIP